MSANNSRIFRYIPLSIAAIALLISGALVTIRAQSHSQESQLAVNSMQVQELTKVTADHQEKIEALQVAMAVVKETSEQNNKILWGLLIGTVMMLIERAFDIMKKKAQIGDDE